MSRPMALVGRRFLPGLLALPLVACLSLAGHSREDASTAPQSGLQRPVVLHCPSLAYLPGADRPVEMDKLSQPNIPTLAVPSLGAPAESAMLPQFPSPLPAPAQKAATAAASMADSDNLPVQHLIVPVYVRRPVASHFHGFLGRLFGPLLSPMTNGLDDTAWGLNGTAASVQMLQEPLQGLQSPLEKLASPLGGLATPLTLLSQPLTLLAQPITSLARPIQQLGTPVHELSRSASSLNQPIGALGNSLLELRRPLTGMQSPLAGLHGPLTGVASSLTALQPPLYGLQRPLTQLATPIQALQQEMHMLRAQLLHSEKTIMDIGRNVTLAIVFGSSIIAYAIWTHRKVPAAVEPTVTTMETHPHHAADGTDHQTTVIKTHAAPKAGSAHEQDTEHRQPDAHSKNNDNPPPPPNIIQPPGE